MPEPIGYTVAMYDRHGDPCLFPEGNNVYATKEEAEEERRGCLTHNPDTRRAGVFLRVWASGLLSVRLPRPPGQQPLPHLVRLAVRPSPGEGVFRPPALDHPVDHVGAAAGDQLEEDRPAGARVFQHAVRAKRHRLPVERLTPWGDASRVRADAGAGPFTAGVQIATQGVGDDWHLTLPLWGCEGQGRLGVVLAKALGDLARDLE